MARLGTLLAAGLALALAALAGPAQATARIALVVGNSAYGSVPVLDNPVPDARLIADALADQGFEVTLVTDAALGPLNRAIAQFGRDLRAAGPETTGLFYYAGHGVQSFGTNYLLPVDAGLTDAADLDLVGVQAEAVLRQMASARNRTNIVILDACRDNPFEDIPEMNDNGLAEMKAPRGTFLAYATAPGSVAYDGEGVNSPFTTALAAQIPVPGLPIEQLFKRVRNDVLEETRGLQVPWDTSSLTAEFAFVEAAPVSPEEVAEARLYESIVETRDPLQIMLFLRAYPDSARQAEARALLSEALNAELGEVGGAPAATADAAPAPAGPSGAEASAEAEAFERARSAGAAEDYRTFLDAYPSGTFAELAEIELAAIAAREAQATPAPAPEEAPIAATAAPEPETRTTELAGAVTFNAPLGRGEPEIATRSLAQLLEGSPLFPPIDGIPEEMWKGQSCSNCHAWTAETLCTQAETYLAATASRALLKDHPYGGAFKEGLRNWAENGCTQ